MGHAWHGGQHSDALYSVSRVCGQVIACRTHYTARSHVDFWLMDTSMIPGCYWDELETAYRVFQQGLTRCASSSSPAGLARISPQPPAGPPRAPASSQQTLAPWLRSSVPGALCSLQILAALTAHLPLRSTAELELNGGPWNCLAVSCFTMMFMVDYEMEQPALHVWVAASVCGCTPTLHTLNSAWTKGSHSGWREEVASLALGPPACCDPALTGMGVRLPQGKPWWLL